MRKTRHNLMALAIALTAGLAACDTPEWDILPIDIYINVSNSSGQNLLDTATPDNFLGKEITAEWKGETYTADSIFWINKAAATRMYLAEMFGLHYTSFDGTDMLYFGELSGHATFNDEPLTIHWPDGSTDVITVKASAHEGFRDVTLKRKFKLNGKTVAKDTSCPVINIVK